MPVGPLPSAMVTDCGPLLTKTRCYLLLSGDREADPMLSHLTSQHHCQYHDHGGPEKTPASPTASAGICRVGEGRPFLPGCSASHRQQCGVGFPTWVALGALTGTGGMVAVDGVGLGSWGKSSACGFQRDQKARKASPEAADYKGACGNSLAHTLEDWSSQA